MFVGSESKVALASDRDFAFRRASSENLSEIRFTLVADANVLVSVDVSTDSPLELWNVVVCNYH